MMQIDLEHLEPRRLLSAGPAVMPGPTNTGPTTANLTAMNGPIYLDTPGETLSGVAITGSVEIGASNVTLSDFTLNANGNGNAIYVDQGLSNVTISDGTISNVGPTNFNYAINGYGAFTADALNIFNIAGSPFLVDGGSNPTTIENCWLHQIGWYASGITVNYPGYVGQSGVEHTDDIFMSAGNLTCIDNNFDTPANTTVGGINYACDAVFFIDQYAATPNNATVTIENNYLDGGGYMFYLMGQGAAMIENNLIGPDLGYANGYLYDYVGNTPLTWNNNVLSATGQVLSAPVVNADDELVSQPSPQGPIESLSQPSVTTDPQSQSVNPGATVTLSAAFSGEPTPAIQWEISTNDGQTFTAIAGATGGSYSVTATAAMNGDQYVAVGTNSQGSATTTIATLSVAQPVQPPPPPPPSNTLIVGTGAGDYANLQAAQNAATGTSGDTILVEINTAGCYFNGATTNETIIGDGGQITGVCSDGQDGIDAEPGLANGLTISNLTFTGKYSRAEVRIEQAADVTVSGCKFAGTAEWGVYTSHNTDDMIRADTFTGTETQHAIYLANSVVLGHVISNVIGGNSEGSAIELNGDLSDGSPGICTYCVIEGNTISGGGSAGGAAINLDGVQDSEIIANTIAGALHTGIALFDEDSAAGPSGDLIEQNTIRMASKNLTALEIENPVAVNTVLGNDIIVGKLSLARGTVV